MPIDFNVQRPSVIWNARFAYARSILTKCLYSAPVDTTCVQRNGTGVEDCLYMSITARRDAISAERPSADIVVYLHGGDFTHGSRQNIE